MELPELTERLVRLSKFHLAAVHPEFTHAFLEARKRYPDSLAASQAVVENMTTPGFAGFERLFTAVLDVEHGGLRVKYALKFLGTTVSPDTLDALNLNQGAWVDYHFHSWLLAMHGYLERVRKMLLQLERGLGKLAPATGQTSEECVKDIEALIARLDEHRNNAAHGGGPVENIVKSGAVREATVLGIWVPITKDVLQVQEQFQARWYEGARVLTEEALVVVQRAAQAFIEATDWSTLESRARAGQLRLPVDGSRRGRRAMDSDLHHE